ncbi:uncharacterized protein J8A68_001961 [[Candida] subhashii]|uniref:J domain-containing protein n=1 Tax=[Candida] subhashii TaxID=561895 RepID=A0A8J5R0B0_9ASCO|nr:uncharacterized protein J8A68_001961 [[Candida] subhashii]KAG7664510.1 hypothetical protein J8A68_001961 [[Candida] subhashii]
MDDVINNIISNNIDIYSFLQVQYNATSQEIRRSYRQKALLYHPDKQSGDESKFNLLLKSYEILSDPSLRSQYDNLIAAKRSREINREKLDELTKRFQDELKANEKRVDESRKKRKWDNDLDKLREEGLKRRRAKEQELLNEKLKTNGVTTIYDLPIDHIITDYSSLPTKVRLKYKYKSEMSDARVIRQIMIRFGVVKDVTVEGHDDRYGSAIVEFYSLEDAKAAEAHDYNGPANKWNGTKVRKSASLLRSCERVIDDSCKYSRNATVNEILEKYVKKNVKSVSDKDQ